MTRGTHPVGYVEVQRSFIGPGSTEEVRELLRYVKDMMARDEPNLKYRGSRLEKTFDGAGVAHYTLYVGFVPKDITHEPLNPRNLNNAPLPRIGGLPDEVMLLGMKERKF